MFGGVITRGRNSGLIFLSTGSLLPFPFSFLAIFFPKQRACSQANLNHKHHIHLETAIGVERFIAIQLTCQRGQRLIQSSGELQKLPHSKIGRLRGVGKTMSRDGKIDKMMSGYIGCMAN